MGGCGSGYPMWRSRKTTVERCTVLSADTLTSDKLLVPKRHLWGSLRWTNANSGREVASISFRLNTLTPGSEHIRIQYTISGAKEKEPLDYTVGLRPVATPWGARRWFFVCPLVIDGRPCRRRAAKLYLPPGGRYFGCRRCYDLTYTSCRETHKYDAMYRGLARDVGLSFNQVKRMMEE